MGKDYYGLLGISRDADEDAIKRAYKKAALKWHPDRNAGSEEASQKFKEISEAFEVLSDKDKRTVFDQFGEEGLKGAPPPGAGPEGFNPFAGGGGRTFPGGTTFSFTSNMGGGGPRGYSPSDPNKIFESIFSSGIFGGMGGMGSMGSMGGMGGMGGMEDDNEDIGSFFHARSGGGMPGGFSGMGGRPRPTGRANFSGANGARPSASKEPSEITRPLKVSLEELYRGATKHLKVGRKLLSGGTEDKVLEIQVLPGWKSGTKIRFPRAGNEVAGGDAQDLVFVVEERPHERFTRDGSELVLNQKIPLVDALANTGGTRIVEHPDGRKVNVPLPNGVIKPRSESRVPGEGMPIRKEGSVRQKGDLIIRWEVEFPDRLTSSQREGIRKVLA